MPLYTDSNYYYSGGSSQLYSPYYPGSSSSTPSSYSPYTSTYNRSIGGSYVVPISSTRTSSYSSPHGLSSRYQPKLSTITETSPLISAARHNTLMPLTRINSPKYTSYSTPSSVHTPKYIPPRPILINTADIDVSANRYRKRKEEALRQAQRGSDYTSPNSSINRRNSSERRQEEEEQKRREQAAADAAARQAAEAEAESLKEASPDQHINRSTIKRNRAVVRLSIIRSRSKDRNKTKPEDSSSSPEPEKKFKDLPTYEPPEEVPLKWREKLADDLAAIPSYPNKKSPGEVLREKYLIQDSKDDEDYAAQCRAQRMAAGLPKETIEQVIVELDPLHHTVRRLSIPQCPTFHDICEDISSDKIDDDLNAGELRRRASIIQCQEQEILNELQKSASGSFQMITMERRGSHDSVDEFPHKRHSKRTSKKGKKIRTKITAIVDVENAPTLSAIVQEVKEVVDEAISPKPKFTVNVESVEEHHEIHKVIKLPKKKSIKRQAKVKEQDLPEGFMTSLPKPVGSPKKKFVKPSPEVFTFEEGKESDTSKAKSLKSSQSLDVPEKPQLSKSLEKSNSINIELKTPSTPQTPTLPKKEEESVPSTPKTPLTPAIATEQKDNKGDTTKKPLKPSQSLDIGEKSSANKTLEKSSSLNIELKTPTTLKSVESNLDTPPLTPKTPKNILEKIEEKSSPKTLKTPETPTNKTLDKSEEPKTPLAAKKEETKSPPLTPKTTKSLWEQKDEKSSPKTKETSTAKAKEDKTPEPKSTLATKTKEEEKKSLKTSMSLEGEAKPNLSKTLQKSNSVNIELKTPTTPKTPQPETIKEENSETKIATPKPIQKPIKKSDSGEDFWAQIGSRESLYMNKRKKELVESQWQKREDLLESTKEEDVKNIEEIKTVVSSQKVEALKKADEEQKSSKGVVSRSNSNESALKKKTPEKVGKDEKDSPKVLASKDLKSTETKIKTNDKLENAKTPVVTKMSKEATTTKPKTAAAETEAKTTTTKITGQTAKSPEQQEQAEQNKFFSTTAAKSNNNKNEIDINKTAATTTTTTTNTNEKQQQQLLAKTLTLPTENAKLTENTSAPAPRTVAETTTAKQTETKAETTNAVTKAKITDNDNKPLSTKKQASPSDKKSAAANDKTKVKTSPTNTTINADQFITKAPAKANASPNKTKTPTKATTTATSSEKTKKSPDNKKITATTTKTTNDDNQQICNKIKDSDNKTATTTNVAADKNEEKTQNTNETGGGNLSKFATVSNLAQCLHDVDAELADYLPSSAEISENEDYKTDDSDFDYSSIDGWEKLTPSMKKKVKQRRRKEKQAEQARFDPQKKVKIDTTRKLYVKDEAPRYPLVATPRPLWKREKIVYPVEDSDDESDSEESGSTEETEDSDECTTSEEYEDELSPSASSGVKSDSGEPNKENSAIIRMSTCSNDSGFEGGTAPSSPKKMLETSYTYAQFQKSGRFTPPATIIPRFKNYTVDDFHFLAVLGKGSFGKVLLAELRDTTYYYAVKCLKKDVVLEDDDVDSTLIERKVLALGTKHPYLCHLFCTFQTESHLFFVMEYLNGGDLMFHIQESGRFTEERARFYGAEIVSGLKFLHKKGIIYRDLKLDNVLLDYEGHVRIADFGMCKLQIYLDKTADSFCGTPDYMAPEIIKGDKYNQNVDWWSFGVLLYEMLIGQSPFSGCDEDELFWSICNELPWFPVYISAEATSILKGLLEKDHTKRIGSQYSPAGDIVEHIFFRPIDWNLLEKRQIEPPFRPQVKHPLDTQYFDRVFTKERVRLTPIDKDILQSMDQKQFLGFTYTNPHITLD